MNAFFSSRITKQQQKKATLTPNNQKSPERNREENKGGSQTHGQNAEITIEQYSNGLQSKQSLSFKDENTSQNIPVDASYIGAQFQKMQDLNQFSSKNISLSSMITPKPELANKQSTPQKGMSQKSKSVITLQRAQNSMLAVDSISVKPSSDIRQSILSYNNLVKRLSQQSIQAQGSISEELKGILNEIKGYFDFSESYALQETFASTQSKGLIESFFQQVRELLQICLVQGDDFKFEDHLQVVSDILQKMMHSLPYPSQQPCLSTKSLVDQYLLRGLILNTAHSKGNIRKVSRSCIANYVRNYQDLKPILAGFKQYGIIENNDKYSQQCIILILPNLLNLDPKVIDADCSEFTELILQLKDHKEKCGKDEKCELLRSVFKVFGELNSRFPIFPEIYKRLTGESSTQTFKGYLSSQEGPSQTPQLIKKINTQQLELPLGFIDQQTFEKMQLNLNGIEKIKAFESCLSQLQACKQLEKVKYSELVNIILGVLSDPNTQSQSGLVVSCIRMLNFHLQNIQQQQKTAFNISKVSSILSHKLNDSNKIIRQEAQHFFTALCKSLGVRAYLSTLIQLIDSSSQQISKVSTHLDSLLNLLIPSVTKIKARDDLDLHKLVETMDTVWEQDPRHQSKIQDALHAVSQSQCSGFTALDVMSEVRNLFDNKFQSQMEERLGLQKESYRRNGNKDHQAAQQQVKANSGIFQFSQDKLDPENFKKKQLLLPNINHLQNSSPVKLSTVQSANSHGNQNSQLLTTTNQNHLPSTENSHRRAQRNSQNYSTKAKLEPAQEDLRPNIALHSKYEQILSKNKSHNQTIEVQNQSSELKTKILQKRQQTNRYESGSLDIKNQSTTSPFTTTTMSSISDKLTLIKMKEIDRESNSDKVSEYDSTQKSSVLIKHRYNSQSHQILPKLNQIQKNPSQQKIDNYTQDNRDANKTLLHSPNGLIEMKQEQSATQKLQSSNYTSKAQLSPAFFQQTSTSLAGSIDQFSTKATPHNKGMIRNTSNQNFNPKPGSGFTQGSTMKMMRGTVNSMSGTGPAETTSFLNGEQQQKQYMQASELEPLVNCELEWKMFLNDIKSDNWSRQFEACNILRRVCKFHLKDILYGSKSGPTQTLSKQTQETFHEINQSVVKMVESLRSTVSKQAMITLYEMLESLPKQLIEPDLESIFQVLIKRSIDTNLFVSEEADKTLVAMCRAVSEGKILTALLSQKSSKSSILRAQICRCLCVLFIKLKQKQQNSKLVPSSGKMSDNERNSLAQIGAYIQDAAAEVRNQAKVSLRQITNLFDEFSNRKELKSQIMMSMGESTYTKVLEFIDNECV